MLLIGRIYGLGSCRLPYLAASKLFYGFKTKGTRKFFQKAPRAQNGRQAEAKTLLTRKLSGHNGNSQQRQAHETIQGRVGAGSSADRTSELNQFDSGEAIKKAETPEPQNKAAKSRIQEDKTDEKSRQIIEQLNKAGQQSLASTLLLHLQRKNWSAYHQSLLQFCWKLYPQPLPMIINAITLHYFSPEGLKQLNNTAAAQLFQKCLAAYSQQIINAIEMQNQEFTQLLRLWMTFNQYRLNDSEEMGKFANLLMRSIASKMVTCDISTPSNFNAIEQYLKKDSDRHILVTQIDFFLAFCEQMAFFPFEMLQRSMQVVFTSKKLYFLLRSRPLKVIMEIIAIQADDLIEAMSLQLILNIVNHLMKISNRYQDHFEQRDKLVGMIFLAVLQKKLSNNQSSFNLQVMIRLCSLIGGRIILEEPHKVRFELFAFLFKEIRRLDSLKPQSLHHHVKMLEEVLTLLFKFQLLKFQECRLELEQLRKKMKAIANIEEQTLMEFQQFLSREAKEMSQNLSRFTFEEMKKLGSYQIYDKLSQAIKGQELSDVEWIVKILLSGWNGHYFYSFCKVRVDYHRAQALFNQAINLLAQHKRLYIFKDIFYRNIKKFDRRNFTINEILQSLPFHNKLDFRKIWSYYFMAWTKAYQEDVLFQDRKRLISSFFNHLIKLKDTTQDSPYIFCNPHFYSVLTLILQEMTKSKFSDGESVNYYCDLLEYLLIKQKQNQLIKSLLASLIYNPKIDQLISHYRRDSSFTDLLTSIIKFKMRYKSLSLKMDASFHALLSEGSPIQLTEYQNRLILLYQGESQSKQPLPILKENLLLLLAENGLYSTAEQEKIDALLPTCDDYELSQILCSSVYQLIPRTKLKVIWKLFLQKLGNINRIMWRSIISNYFYEKDWLVTESKILGMKLLQYYQDNADELSIGNFKILSDLFHQTGLILHERQAMSKFLETYCQEHFQTYLYMPRDKIFEFFKCYMLAGYRLKLEFLGQMIQQISRRAECYQIIFSYEDHVEPKQFQKLLKHFIFHRQDYLQEQHKIEGTFPLDLLTRKYASVCSQFLALNQEKNTKLRRLMANLFQYKVYKRLSYRYEGVVYKNLDYIEVQDSIISISKPLNQGIKNKFVTKVLNSNPQTKDKAIRFIQINSSSTVEQAAEHVASQLGLKLVSEARNLNHQEKNLEEILKEAADVDLKYLKNKNQIDSQWP